MEGQSSSKVHQVAIAVVTSSWVTMWKVLLVILLVEFPLVRCARLVQECSGEGERLCPGTAASTAPSSAKSSVPSSTTSATVPSTKGHGNSWAGGAGLVGPVGAQAPPRAHFPFIKTHMFTAKLHKCEILVSFPLIVRPSMY